MFLVSMSPGISPAPVIPNALKSNGLINLKEEQLSYLHLNDGHLECYSSPTLNALTFEVSFNLIFF